MSASQASLLLQKQLRDLCKAPVDGFSAGLVDESNVFEWRVTIIGPPDTLYDGGFFSAIMSFPSEYPQSPPTVRFTSEMWHPNVYPDGRVCISILHPPGDDPNGYEHSGERWMPVHTPLKLACWVLDLDYTYNYYVVDIVCYLLLLLDLKYMIKWLNFRGFKYYLRHGLLLQVYNSVNLIKTEFIMPVV